MSTGLPESKPAKSFVLDTNVLIHNPAALFSFGNNTIILPITVIEELDKFKHTSDKKGAHARQVLREIDHLIKKGALQKGAKIRSGGKLKIAFKDLNIPEMDPLISDNKILAVAWDLQNKGESVFFISKDVNARIKAEALGINAQDYEKQKVDYSNLYKGWKTQLVSHDEINSLYKNQSLEIKSNGFLDNEYVLVKSNDGAQSSALAQYHAPTNQLTVIRDHADAMGIKPLNMEQRFACDMLLNEKIKLVTLVGIAGTGKTLLALACGLAQTIGKAPIYKKILVARPIIPLGRDIGYLPGTKDQKLNYWMQPIFDNLRYILHKDDPMEHKDGFSGKKFDKIDYLLDSDTIEIEALTYIRGRSIPRQFIIIDEAQNLTPHEVKTIVSRAGEGTKIVLTGDPEQIDNPYLDANSNGLTYSVERLKGQSLMGHIQLSKSERSALASLAAELL